MELTFGLGEDIGMSEDLITVFEDVNLRISTDRTKGIYSECLRIGFYKDDFTTNDISPYISIAFNRNQAIYIRNFIDAFLKEDETLQ